MSRVALGVASHCLPARLAWECESSGGEHLACATGDADRGDHVQWRSGKATAWRIPARRVAGAQSFRLNDRNAERVGAGENIGRASLPQKKLSYQT